MLHIPSSSFRQWLCSALVSATFLPAQTGIFFVEYAYQAAQLKVMRKDGRQARTVLHLPSSFWVPLDLNYDAVGQQLLWCDGAGQNRLMHGSLHPQSVQTTLLTNGPVRGPGFDALGRLFYTEGNTVRRANANGTGAVVLFTAQQIYPIGCPLVDATNGHVYVGADNCIVRFDLNGGNQCTVITGLGQARAIALDVARGFLYWIDTQPATDHVARARLDNTEHTVLHDNTPANSQSPGLLQLTLDLPSQTLYVAEELWFRHIIKVPTDGSPATPIYVSPPGLSPSGIVLASGQNVQPIADCNRNGVPDTQDLALGTSLDCNGNGYPDECEAAPCPTRTYFLDQGSNPQVPSRATGCAGLTSNTCFQVFQPFDVPAPGVALGTIGLDGWTSNYANGEGLTAEIFRDDGTGQFADESVALAAVPMQLRFDPDHTNWVYAPLSLALLPGRYWVRLTSNAPTYFAGVNVGNGPGLQSKSRSGNGTWFQNQPIALRLATAPLAASATELSLSSGRGRIDFVLDAGPTHALETFWLLGSILGTSPGLTLGPSLTLPLVVDPYFLFLAEGPNRPPVSNGFGQLSSAGMATATFQLPASVPSALLGLRLHHAYLTLAGANVPQFVSNAVTFTLVP